MKNGIALVQVGRVSVLVCETPEHAKSVGKLLVNGVKGNPSMTRIAFAPDNASTKELSAALKKTREKYPLPRRKKS